VEARGVTPKHLEQAATNLYLHLITRRPDAMLRAQHLFLPDYAWPNESEDLDDLRRSIEQIFEEPLYARVHPAFASISDPGSRDGPMLIPAKAIAPLLAVLILIGTVGPRTIRGLVPVGPAFAALLGGSAYVASTIAAILFYKTTYLVAFTAVGAGVSIVIVACAIENALRSRRGIEKSRGVVERIEPVPPARGARG